MLSGKGKVALAGLAAAIGVAAMASGKKEEPGVSPKRPRVTSASDWPRAGETWHYVYSYYPDLPSKEAADQVEYIYRDVMNDVATVNSFDLYSNKNTLDIVLTYKKRPPANQAVGETVTFDMLTVILTEKDRVS